MTLNSVSIRRFLLGEESRFVESLLGRLTVIVLFSVICGVILALLFLVNQQIPPVALKFTVLMALGLADGFMSRRLLVGRNGLLQFLSAIFALLITLDLLSLITHGFLGLNLLHGAAPVNALDTALQLIVPITGIWLALRAWRGQHRQVLVEPREFIEPEVVPVQPSRPVRRPRVNFSSLSANLNRRLSSAISWGQQALRPTPGVRTRKKVHRATRRPSYRGRGSEIALSMEEKHVCPYCLEPVVKRDPRGVKICKVCKTWHHADCWAITGVCQVPHQYES